MSLTCATTQVLAAYLQHLHNVETLLYCPQTFLYLEFQCRDVVSELQLSGLKRAYSVHDGQVSIAQ